MIETPTATVHRPKDVRLMRFSAVLIAAIAGGVIGQPSDDVDEYHAQLQRVHAEARVSGATACSNCHSGGRTGRQPGAKTGIAADLWRGRDFDGAHFRAYQTLHTDPSKAMGRLLATVDGSEPDPTKRNDCLSCHAFGHDIPENRKQKAFQIEDGVSCEACHGHSERWQTPHQYADWHARPAGDWLEAGMYDTRDLRRWAEKCLECHLGTGGKVVDHTMMGAGHPALTLELATDTFGVPKHWEDRRTYLSDDENSWYYARLWAVGQAVALRETAARIGAWAQQPGDGPDFAFFDCYACHHEFLKTPARSPGRGLDPKQAKSGATAVRLTVPGQPAWNAASWVITRHLLEHFSPADRAELDRKAEILFGSFLIRGARPDAVGGAARDVERIANELAARVVGKRFDRAAVREILVAMTLDADAMLAVGPIAADQLFGALNALYYLAWAGSDEKPANDAEIMAGINALRSLIYDEDGTLSSKRFDPVAFRRVMADLAEKFASAQ